MSARVLLDTLDGLGVRATLTPGGNLRLEPASRVPPDLVAELREHKAALIASLSVPAGMTTNDSTLPLLPETLARLVHAAASGHLGHMAQLESGFVPDLGGYVLAWAATYATGSNTRHTLACLEAAYKAWKPA
ncbi:hypothetical protein [Deinococcus peraridilitoris]|uniref:TubC N-terminal docking domain-containing protein n=1 Tax=Deinococcus peraridilitoris (strain DSM 19664 / LMG 22246 / CIP 109416 / KR-200) TaxID=937777 RepID=L0A4E0_DEIPD|nr:hypothetical protein [Deinococcus peraridilitoris]AFZ67895.1 hypothetical protein Deipe_2420 [Deinococcus peraridilitoris DSM 19664]